MKQFSKDPEAVLDYTWDWSAWLGEDSIDSFVVTPTTGLTLDSAAESQGVVVAWFSGGVLGQTHMATCEVHTLSGRIEQQTARFVMESH